MFQTISNRLTVPNSNSFGLSFVAETNRSALLIKSVLFSGDLAVATETCKLPKRSWVKPTNLDCSKFLQSFPSLDWLWQSEQVSLQRRMVCSKVFLDHLETSNPKKDLRNVFFSKFYDDPCLADFFSKVILWRKLKIEKSSDFFLRNRTFFGWPKIWQWHAFWFFRVR